MDSTARKLPVIAKVYIAAVILDGLILAGSYALSPGTGWPSPGTGSLEIAVAAILFTAAAFLSELYPVPVPTSNLFDDSKDALVMSSAIYIGSLLLYGPAFTMVIGAAANLLSDFSRGKPLYKGAFNAAQNVVALGISGLFLRHTGHGSYYLGDLVTSPQGFLSLLATIATYFLLNTSLVAAVIAMVDGTSFIDVWRQFGRQMLLEYVGMLNIGLVGALLWTVTPLGLVLLVLPLLVVYQASKTTSQLKSETTRALIAVADMVDSRDSYAYRHSMEVARYSAQIATKMGLPLDEVEMIKLAAQLHDIGKIGTPDDILHKPGALNPEEMAVMQKHPAEGAKVLQYFSLFRPGAELVLYHQEHYDGTGYPAGLAARQIPLGARIIHVADAYQAMTSDRVYRRAMDVNVAVRRLLAGTGRQFDPAVVKALMAVLQESGVPFDGSLLQSPTVTPSSPQEQQSDVLQLRGADRPDPGHSRP